MVTEKQEYDSPWKAALETYFPQFIELLFPEAHAGIDWSKKHEFLDSELQQVVRDAELGKRLADKLVKVFTKEGPELWLLIHVEVQGQQEAAFPKRMYVYNYRLFDRYDQQIVSFAVLADEQETWRPDRFGYERWGCKVRLEFPVVKLLDYRLQWEALAGSTNPFAFVVMAHLKAQETRNDMERRLAVKLGLLRQLYRKSYSREDILELFRFLDWLMNLPEWMERKLETELKALEEGEKMPYVTGIERRAEERGRQEGRVEGLKESLQRIRGVVIGVLQARFGSVPASIEEQLEAISDAETLEKLGVRAAITPSLDDFQRAMVH